MRYQVAIMFLGFLPHSTCKNINIFNPIFSCFHRLGSLACFFDGALSLNLNQSRKLLSQIDACKNSEIDKVRTATLLNHCCSQIFVA